MVKVIIIETRTLFIVILFLFKFGDKLTRWTADGKSFMSMIVYYDFITISSLIWPRDMK